MASGHPSPQKKSKNLTFQFTSHILLIGMYKLQSQSQSYFAADGQSVLALSPSGTHDQILSLVMAVAGLFVFVMGCPP
jgi:hypothetical protein